MKLWWVVNTMEMSAVELSRSVPLSLDGLTYIVLCSVSAEVEDLVDILFSHELVIDFKTICLELRISRLNFPVLERSQVQSAIFCNGHSQKRSASIHATFI